MRLPSAVPLLLAFAALPAAADDVHLKSGGCVVGTVVDDGDPVVVRTPMGGTLRIARDKVERIEKKALPVAPGSDIVPRRELKPATTPRHVDLFNGYAIRPPPGWIKIATAKNSKATWGAPADKGPFRMDLWIIQAEKTDLGNLFETFRKTYREAFRNYKPLWESGTLLGSLPAKQFAGEFLAEGGEETAHVHTLGSAGPGRFYLVFFTGAPDQLDGLKADFLASFASFEELPPLTLSKEKIAEFMKAYTRGVELVHEGKNAEAAAEFERASAILPEHADTHQNLAILHAKMENRRRSIEEYVTLTKLRPDDAQAFHDLGTMLFHENRLADAVRALERALELAPDYVEAWINLGAVRTQEAAHEAAVLCFKTAIEIDPECAPAWFNLGQVEYLRNHHKDARAAYEQALKLQPDHAGAKEGLKKLKQEGR